MSSSRTSALRSLAIVTALSAALAGCSAPSSDNDNNDSNNSANNNSTDNSTTATADSKTLLAATYNTSLHRDAPGKLIEDLKAGDEQAQNIAAVIQRNNPDVILLNEFDYDDNHEALDIFREQYLTDGQQGQDPVDYPYFFTAPVNTGVDSGMDLDANGTTGDPGDAWGFGEYPGQYGMAILSKFPLDSDKARTFQKLRWADMPNNRMPADFYESATKGSSEKLRLSSKSHWDVPVDVEGETIHLLVSHPTPPSFEGPEKRNTRRNGDEIRLTADYIAGGSAAEWITDDKGTRGGLAEGERFIVFGDQNSDPADGGNSGKDGIRQVLDLDQVCDPKPTSRGAAEAAKKQQGNDSHSTPAEQDTADFSDPKPGNLRVDYVLPSCDLDLEGSGVFWPADGEELGELMSPKVTSDHRLVWTQVRL